MDNELLFKGNKTNKQMGTEQQTITQPETTNKLITSLETMIEGGCLKPRCSLKQSFKCKIKKTC